MAEFSPTGYWAHYKFLLPDGTKTGPGSTYKTPVTETLPLVGWDHNGEPLVVDGRGRRVLAKDYTGALSSSTILVEYRVSATTDPVGSHHSRTGER